MAFITIPYKNTGDELTAAEFNQILDAIEFGNLDIKTTAVYYGSEQLGIKHLSDVDLTGLATDKLLVYDDSNTKWILKDYHEHSNKSYLDVIDQELSTTSDVSFNSIVVSSNAEFSDLKINQSAYFDEEVSASSTIDWTQGNKQSITLTGDVTLTFTDPNGPCNLILKIVQDSTGGHSVTFPSNVKWEGGNVPDLSTDSGDTVRIVSLYFDGTNYYAQITDAY